MPLEIDNPKLVRADRQVDTCLLAFDQHGESGLFELRPADLVVPRMGRVESAIDSSRERMLGVCQPVAVDTPLFSGHALPIDSMSMFEQCVRCQAGTQDGRNILLGPSNHFDQWLPEGFLIQRGMFHIGTTDD